MNDPLSVPLSGWPGLARHGKREGPSEPIDVLVIGSGYGGSVAALRLAEQGRQVVLLERGAEFLPGDFPNELGQLPKFVRAHGMAGPVGSLGGHLDLRIGKGMASVVANGLGGGSLINAGVLMRPDADVFSQPAWPSEIRHALDARPTSEGALLGLDPAFAQAFAMLGGEVFRDRGAAVPGSVSRLPKAQALVRTGEALRGDRALRKADPPQTDSDARPRPATVTIDLAHCTRCGDCMTGCNVPGAKKTLATNYLLQAHRAGAEIVTRALVYSIAPRPEGGWWVRVMPTEHGHHARRLADVDALHGTTLHANAVVLAAGTFGSTELLLRSRQLAGKSFSLSPTLGTRLSGNGDSLSVLADLPAPVDGLGHGAATLAGAPPVGPTITTVLDLRDHAALDQRVVIQEGAVPGALVPVFMEAIAATWVLHHLGRRWRTPRANGPAVEPLAASRNLARHTQLLLAMGHDGSAGRIVWLPEMDGAVPYWAEPHKIATHERQQRLFDAAMRGTGGVHLQTPLWKLIPPGLDSLASGLLPEPTLLTVHPLGGCPMGDGFDDGVVNHLGQVWKSATALWAGLYVLDGSIVPSSLGCNPLWTITALAERAMAHWKAKAPAAPAASACVATPVSRPASRQVTEALPPPRTPKPLARGVAPAFAFEAAERMELRALPLGRRLAQALGQATVESDLRIRMRADDWPQVWQQARHRLAHVRGELRLVVPPPPGASGAAGPSPRVEYRIVGGTVDLFSHRAPVPVLGAILRGLRTLRVGLTWWLLRGRRDLRNRDDALGWLSGLATRDLPTIWRLGWQAAEVRHARYDLALERSHAVGAAGAPLKLRLRAVKKVSYAASWWELACQGLFLWRNRRVPPDHPDRAPPRELRANLLDQLTRPVVTLDDEAGWARWLPTWLVPPRLSGSTRARFVFDAQESLQRPPFKLHRGGDTSAAAVALLSYPAFIARLLLLTRLLEFPEPEYARRPAINTASPWDVALRVIADDGTDRLSLLPEEIALKVRRGRSSSDDGAEPPNHLSLRLWRYRRLDPATGEASKAPLASGTWCGLPVRRAKSVLLMHAFDMSGLSFTFKETSRNFAEHLYAEGWEVWILDSRMSPRTSAAVEPCTVDQLGLIDAPQAVQHILDTLAAEHPGAATPIQIHAFGQCMGAAALSIGLLSGELAYRDRIASAEFGSATGELPRMPKLAGLVTSQTHPFIVGARAAQAKTWVPALLRNLAGRTLVPLAVRGAVGSVVEAIADRLLAGLPVPDGEHCHAEGHVGRPDDDDCATCRRIRFLLGGMFLHRNVNWATHRALPRLFGAGSVRLFAHGAKFFEYEHLVSEDGFNVYVTDEAIGRYLALPLRFLHGRENDLFDSESAVRSARRYARLHAGWAHQFGLPSATEPVPQVCDVIDGYGHLDVLIGQEAMDDSAGASVYDRLAGLLHRAWDAAHVPAPLPAAGAAAPAPLVVRFPKAGPFLGPVTGPPGERRIGIAFVLDDGATESAQGQMTQAGALVGHAGSGGAMRLQPLAIDSLAVAVPARDGLHPPKGNPNEQVGLRVAHGTLPLPAHCPEGGVSIECLSYTHAGTGAAGADTETVLHTLRAALREARLRALRMRSAARRPFPETLSRQRRSPPHGGRRKATVPAHVANEPGPGEPVTVAIGCCRYGGFAFDRRRADLSFRRLLNHIRSKDGAKPQLLLMLGDQIYADRSAGLADPLSPTERFLFRHQQAFTTPALHALMAQLPTVCLPDDHEFIDAYPLGRPLFRGRDGRAGHAMARARRAAEFAERAMKLYQQMQLPASARDRGCCEIDRGDVRFFVLDTRLHRRRNVDGSISTLPPAALPAFVAWLESARGDTRLHCLVTSSVILPGLLTGADPAYGGAADTLQASPAERCWLLERLIDAVPGRFVLIAGDYHVSLAAELCLDGGRTVGAAIVAPPFYAPLPYANTAPSDVWLDETITLPAGTLSVRCVPGGNPQRGSGYGLFSAARAGEGWRIELEAELIDFELRGKPGPDGAAATAPRHAWSRPVIELPGS